MGNSNVGARWQSQCGAFHPPPRINQPDRFGHSEFFAQSAGFHQHTAWGSVSITLTSRRLRLPWFVDDSWHWSYLSTTQPKNVRYKIPDWVHFGGLA